MTDPTSPGVPAGWYPDSALPGTQRYWDGQAWTAHTAPLVAAPPVAVAAPPAPAGWVAPGQPVMPPRNGLGIAALVLGIVGIVFGLIPLTFFIAGTLGLIGLILGIVGLSRARRGTANNTKVAVAGIVTSVLAMLAAVVGIVILVSATKDAIDAFGDLDGSPGISRWCADERYPDQQTNDVCADDRQTVTLEDVAVTATALKPRTDDVGGKALCTTVTIKNGSSESQDYNVFDFKVQTPGGVVATDSSTNFAGTLNSGTLIAGATTSGDVCTDDAGERGNYVLIYKPNAFESKRGIWLEPVS